LSKDNTTARICLYADHLQRFNFKMNNNSKYTFSNKEKIFAVADLFNKQTSRKKFRFTFY